MGRGAECGRRGCRRCPFDGGVCRWRGGSIAVSERVESRVFFGEIVFLTGVLRFGLTAVAVLLDVASLFFLGGGLRM